MNDEKPDWLKEDDRLRQKQEALMEAALKSEQWQDKPDSDGLWWVVNKGEVTIVDIAHHLPNGELSSRPVRGVLGSASWLAFGSFDGPWLKADVPPMPEKAK